MINIKKAAVWADSIFKGVLYDDQNKKYRLAKKNGIKDTSDNLGIELENNAHYGLTAPKAARLLHEKIASNSENVEMALIELGGNDSDYRWSDVSLNPLANHLPNTSLDDFRLSIKQMINDLRNKGIEPVLVNLPPIDAKRYFDWISKGLDKNNILLWLGNVDRIYTSHEVYSLAIMDVAKELNCQMIDIRSEFLQKDYRSFLCTDGIHLNELGQGFLNTILFNYFNRLKLN